MNFVNRTLWGEFFFFLLLLPPSIQNIFLKKFSISKWTDVLLEFIFEIDGDK